MRNRIFDACGQQTVADQPTYPRSLISAIVIYRPFSTMVVEHL